jgi:hypothetical protein
MVNSLQRPRGVIVLGVFRSGTSQISRVLQALEVDFGPAFDLFAPTQYNPWGFFQRRDVLAANNRLLHSAGCSADFPAEPEKILQRADPTCLLPANLNWISDKRTWGLKDPRFSATLLTWIECGRIDPKGLVLVNVSRGSEATAASILRFPVMATLLPNVNAGNVRTLVDRYRELAAWHISRLGLPTLTVCLEDLIQKPQQEVEKLANFVGCTNPNAIESAVQSTNRERVLQIYFTQRAV